MIILIADNEALIREVVMSSLRQMKYTDIIEAEDGLQALHAIKSDPAVQIVIAGIRMPEVDGFQLRGFRDEKYFYKVFKRMTGFVKSIPKEIDESAFVDGAKGFGLFVRIILPLLLPSITTALVFVLLGVWNDFQ